MLATGLVFIFGALVATLVALLLVPLVWREAQKLARRDFVATLPASMNEIRAEVDRVRAEAAMNVRRQEIITAQTREAHAMERAAAGRLTSEKDELQRRIREEEERNATLREEIEALTERLKARDEMFVEVEGEHRGLRRDFEMRAEEMEALAERFRELDNLADERRVRLVAADTKVDGLQSEVRSLKRALAAEKEARADTERRFAEVQGQLNHLRGEDPELPIVIPLAEDAPAASDGLGAAAEGAAASASAEDRMGEEARAAIDELRRHSANATPEELAAVRERIAEIAARVVHLTAQSEGPNSPLHAIIGRGENEGDLIARVRRLQAAEAGEQDAAAAPAAYEVASAEPESDPQPALADHPVAETAAETPPADVPPAEVSAEPVRKRRGGGARSRQRSRR